MAGKSLENNIELRKPQSNDFTELKRADSGKKKYKKENLPIIIALIILIILYLFSIGFFVTVPETSKYLSFYLDAAKEKFTDLLSFLGGADIYSAKVDLIRYTSVILCGGALAAAGAVFQGGFRNIIASPTTMGVQSGATLGNAIYMLLLVDAVTGTVVIQHNNAVDSNLSFFMLNIQQIFAMCGALLSVALVSGFTYLLGRGKFSTANILFSGMIFSSFVGSITSVIQYYFLYCDDDDTRWRALRELTMGSFDKIITVQHLISIAIVLIPCMVALIYMSPKLNILSFGEEEARSMGLNAPVYRNLLIAIGSVMTGTIIAFCGQIGFVGFIVPQISRRIVGNDFKKLVIMSIIVGGILMLLVFNLALFVGFTRYLNVFTSVIGCTMMIYSFVKSQRRKLT